MLLLILITNCNIFLKITYIIIYISYINYFLGLLIICQKRISYIKIKKLYGRNLNIGIDIDTLVQK